MGSIFDHLRYASYLARHKWHVYRAARRLGLGVWVSLVHDWSKLLPDEWFPYLNHFYRDGDPDFEAAWLHHIHRNPHHWQYWVLINDDEGPVVLQMPDRYRREMLADWIGANKVGDGDGVLSWYIKRSRKLILHPMTRLWIEAQLMGPTQANRRFVAALRAAYIQEEKRETD